MSVAARFQQPEGLRYHGGAVLYALLAYGLGWAGLFAHSWPVNIAATLLLAHGMTIAAYMIHECGHNLVFRSMRHLSLLHDRDTGICVAAERALNERLNGGCQVPIAGFAQIKESQLMMDGLVGSPNGSVLYRSSSAGPLEEAESIGRTVADDLLAQGADKILEALYRQ